MEERVSKIIHRNYRFKIYRIEETEKMKRGFARLNAGSGEQKLASLKQEFLHL